MHYPTETIDHLIQTRRSVKPEKYLTEPVADAIVLQMLENARWAPTHGMTEPWRFFVFTGQGLQEFAAFQSGLYKSVTLPETFNEAKYQKLLNTPLKASHVILIGMKRQVIGKIPENEEICAVACAVQNMQLTAHAYGIGSYWSTGGMTYRNEMKTFLGLDENDRCLGMLYIGKYMGEIPVPPRAPVEQFATWIR